mmetsp:Transcript_29487/g.44787  ORF Transcript_29487/g.44787 Transcript_29487/m.44787 type:complete len:85 (-) Transcript_29487:2145-2399(-)
MQEENSKLIVEFEEYEKVLSQEKQIHTNLKHQHRAKESEEFKEGIKVEYQGAIEAALNDLTEQELEQKEVELVAAKATSSSLKE